MASNSDDNEKPNKSVAKARKLESSTGSIILADMKHINWKEFVCGWCAALINITITYPINKIIFRQMLHGLPASQAIEQLHKEGIYFLYRGMLPPMCQKTFTISIMFGVYEEIQRPLIHAGFNPYLSKVAGGVVAGTCEGILMPFERVQTLLADAHYHAKFKNTWHTFKVIGKQYGFREYYRGLTPVLLRNGPSNATFFIIRDEVQRRMPKFDSNFHRTVSEFFCGAFIGVTISSLIYPLNVIKVAMQSKIGGENESIFKVLKQIYNDRGGKIRYIYLGVRTNCTRAFLSWGVMNAAYEYLKKIIY